LGLGLPYRPLLTHIEICFLSVEAVFHLVDQFTGHFRLSSVIRRLPQKAFQTSVAGQLRRFRSFGISHRCDGRGNRLTLIFDREGNVFGGFTSGEWESSPKDMFKAGNSQMSFLFTLKNPHNITPRLFPLDTDECHAICCNFGWSPAFWRGCDIAHNNSFALGFGMSYTNNTGRESNGFFTGSTHFTVKEIEVFEITD
jgi:hypothetical protein